MTETRWSGCLRVPSQATELAPTRIEGRRHADTLIVTVRQDHIADGERQSMQDCAVALALQEAGLGPVVVGPLYVEVRDESRSRRAYETSPELLQWMRDFDQGEPVHPERFVLRSLYATLMEKSKMRNSSSE